MVGANNQEGKALAASPCHSSPRIHHTHVRLHFIRELHLRKDRNSVYRHGLRERGYSDESLSVGPIEGREGHNGLYDDLGLLQ